MADQHLLQKKQVEHEDKAAEWMRKAELAVDKKQEDLARAALERYQSFTKVAEDYGRQSADQRLQVDTLRNALEKLEQKLNEARAKCDLLIAQHRRARALDRASDAQLAIGDASNVANFDRMGPLRHDQASERRLARHLPAHPPHRYLKHRHSPLGNGP